MLVKIYAPPYCKHDLIRESGFIELPEGATLKMALDKVAMPKLMRVLPIVLVNYERVKMSRVLHDQDVVTIYQVVASG